MTHIKTQPITKSRIIDALAERIKREYLGEGSGHDWWHIWRVWNMAKYIAGKEKEINPKKQINNFIVEAGVLLHDINDWKFQKRKESSYKMVASLLSSYLIPDKTTRHIANIVNTVSFKGAGTSSAMDSIEGEIVQDADRLDALGAIGITRVFAYGGHKGIPIHDPTVPVVFYQDFISYKNKKSTMINHFYEKLLLLKDRLHTKTAKKIATSRHAFMQDFLKRFYKEWEGKA